MIPGYVARFRDALIDEKVTRLQLEICSPPVQGYHGILTTSRLRYNADRINLLGRHQEFTFELPDRRLELSLQLYLNVNNHWRLFCYTATGMLFSVNLTLLRQKSPILVLSQMLRVISRDVLSRDRRDRNDQLAAALSQLGLEVDHRRLVLGTFDTDAGRFLDTTARAFLRDFTLTALLKGHFSASGMSRPAEVAFRSTFGVAGSNRGSPGSWYPLLPMMRHQVLVEGGGRCAACGRTARDGIKLHVDHIKPYSQGGRTERGNLQVLCHEDNLGKGNRSETRFAPTELRKGGRTSAYSQRTGRGAKLMRARRSGESLRQRQ